jgi:alpha-ribazole phosphatase
MRKIWIIRHGQTDLNVSGVFFGTTDVSLNEAGWKQAALLKDRMPETSFDLIFSSPLERAVQTARIVCPDEVFQKESALSERALGSWESLSLDEIRQRDANAWDAWQTDWLRFQPPGGESFTELWSRVTGFLDALLARSDWNQALLVSHAGPIRCLIAHGLQLPMDAVWRFSPDNACLSCLSFNQEGYGWLSAMNR